MKTRRVQAQVSSSKNDSSGRVRGPDSASLSASALSEILERHAPLVRQQAWLMAARLPANVELDDLIQAGMMGLMDAVRRHPQTGPQDMEGYWVVRIRGAMLDMLREMDWLPRSARSKSRQIEEAVRAMCQTLGRMPTDAEVAETLSLSVSEYQQLVDQVRGMQVLLYEDLRPADQAGQPADIVLRDAEPALGFDPEDAIMRARLREALVAAIEALPDKEKWVLSLQLEQSLNQKETAAVMGLTEGRISQLRTQAIVRIRAWLAQNGWLPDQPLEHYKGLL